MGEFYPSLSNPTYLVCGLRVSSDTSIPDLVPAEFDRPDLKITFQEHPGSRQLGRMTLQYSSSELSSSGEPTVRLFEITSPSSLYVLVYGDGTKFLIDQTGSNVWATWAAESTFEDTLTYLLGPVLGFVLRLRGVTCLHASAIAVDGMAVLLTGPGGAGKSTAAAQFSSMGCAVLSDDIATLDAVGPLFLVHPSPARLRLWPSSVDHLYGHPNALPRLTPSWEKQYLDLRTTSRQFQYDPLPLTAVYVLSNPEGSADRVVEISRSSAMMQLLANVYVNYLLHERFRGSDFVRVANVVNAIPVRQVNLQHDFAALARTCQSILDDCSRVRKGNQQTRVGREILPSFVS